MKKGEVQIYTTLLVDHWDLASPLVMILRLDSKVQFALFIQTIMDIFERNKTTQLQQNQNCERLQRNEILSDFTFFFVRIRNTFFTIVHYCAGRQKKNTIFWSFFDIFCI